MEPSEALDQRARRRSHPVRRVTQQYVCAAPASGIRIRRIRFLALSDIHRNVVAVRQLRSREANRFDAVLVAGDIGSDAAPEILNILSSFECPVLYVFGNWDHELQYDHSFGSNCQHLHLRLIECGSFSCIGFSGCPTHWGQNPNAKNALSEIDDKYRRLVEDIEQCQAALRQSQAERLQRSKEYASYTREKAEAGISILKANRAALVETIKASAAGMQRTIVVTHERLSRTAEDFQGVPLFLLGHRHGFRDTYFNGSRFVNVSALDIPITVRPAGKRKIRWEDYRNINTGNYVIIEGSCAEDLQIMRVCFEPSFDGWVRLQHELIVGAPWADLR